MDFIQGFDRNQLQIMSFDEFVASDSWARVVDLFVDILPRNVVNVGHCVQAGCDGKHKLFVNNYIPVFSV